MEEFRLEIPITFEKTVEEKSTISSAIRLSFVSIILINLFNAPINVKPAREGGGGGGGGAG